MESFRGQGGIQTLLSAEQEAQHIVSKARNSKLARLKQAKDEAERDVGLYRSNMESEFQKKIFESSGSSGGAAKKLEEETQMKIQNLKQSASRVSKDVVDMLVNYITTIRN